MADISDEEKIDTLWELFDMDGNGTLDRGEIEALLNQMGKSDELDMEEVWLELDQDGNGTIDRKEFTEWWVLSSDLLIESHVVINDV